MDYILVCLTLSTGVLLAASDQSLQSLFQLSCYSARCPTPTCAHPIKKPGACCDECPTTPLDCSKLRCAPCLCIDKYIPQGECCPVCPPTPTPPTQCAWNGVTYNTGDSWKQDCNACYCVNGKVKCTKRPCGVAPSATAAVAPRPTPKMCQFNGDPKSNGESWTDGCNLCFCINGEMSCSNNKCSKPQPPTSCISKGAVYNNGDNWQDDCNYCFCTLGRASCTERLCQETPRYTAPALPNLVQPRHCIWEGKLYDDRAKWEDRCNTCSCNNGAVDCSKKLCPQPIPPKPVQPNPVQPRHCVWEGKLYDDRASWEDRCNKCSCNNGGVDCTKMLCPQPIPPKPVQPKPVQPMHCVWEGKLYDDRASWEDRCNKCSCNNGEVDCTKMLCPQPIPPKPVQPMPVQPRHCVWEGKLYDDRASWEDRCNKCSCNNGNVDCTKMLCPPDYSTNVQPTARPKLCVWKGRLYDDKATWKVRCNTCTCNNGALDCTKTRCTSSRPKPYRSKPVQSKSCVWEGKSYDDKATWKVRCNTCSCNNGDVDCSKAFCPPPPPPPSKNCQVRGKTYNDQETWEEDCNTCYCYNGEADCTLFDCRPPPPPAPKPCNWHGSVYEHGKQWSEDCNNCTCIDGKASCTFNTCVPKSCTWKGGVYDHGSIWTVDCNTCTCNNGDASCSSKYCPPKSCTWQGGVYDHGSIWTVDCNTCTCNNGDASCSSKVCPPKPCKWQGGVYDHGSSWFFDGNTCSCNNGDTSCSSKVCTPKPCKWQGGVYDHGSSWSFDCNTCICNNGDASCSSQICTTTPAPPKTCNYKGSIYFQGQTWNDDCNTCVCNFGLANCTYNYCPKNCEFKGKVYKHKSSWDYECNKCTCNDDTVYCSDYKCDPCQGVFCAPPLCTNAVTAPGECCPKCPPPKDCLYKGKVYKHKFSWDDDCNKCECDDDKVYCSNNKCDPCQGVFCAPPLCTNAVTAPGECCPKCPPPKDCQYKGKVYKHKFSWDDDCNKCECDDDKVYCSNNKCDPCQGVFCAPPLCTNAVTAPGECCPKCPPPKDCQYKGKVYKHKFSWDDDCNKCECDDDKVYCSKNKCDPCQGVFCALPLCTNPVTAPGECCPKCPPPKDCQYKGKFYKHKSSWDDDCNKCSCNDNTVYCSDHICDPCQGVFCAPPLCTNAVKVPGECCPKCPPPKNCQYKGKVYKHKSSWDDACNKCTCNDNTVYCSDNKCDPCQGVFCSPPLCANAVMLPGECCPSCPPDPCKGVFCSPPLCANAVMLPGECCPSCPPDPCKGMLCPRPLCANAFTPPGECCPKCPPPPVVCVKDEKVYIDGQSWKDDCNTCYCIKGNVACTEAVCRKWSLAAVAPCPGLACGALPCWKKLPPPPGLCCPICAPGCIANGEWYDEDDNMPSTDVCTDCKCQLGKTVYKPKTCEPVNCDDSYTPVGECCPKCPDKRNS